MNGNFRYPGRGGPRLRLSGRAALPLLLAALALIALGQASGAQALPTLYSFTGGSDGANPRGSLIQATDGNLYGMTCNGGANGDGTVFEIPNTGTPSAPVWGTMIILHSFGGTAFQYLGTTSDGIHPYGSLIQGRDGSLYGMTYEGGTYGYGTVFEIVNTNINVPSAPVWGEELIVHSFVGGASDGAYPYGSLIQGLDGSLYGMTNGGGGSYYMYGTVFKMSVINNSTPSDPVWGAPSIIHSFTDGNDGAFPYGSLIQGSDGNLYGMTYTGGTSGFSGVVFRITPSGTLTTLHSFAGGNSDGANSEGSLIQGSDGNLYGMTYQGGPSRDGTVFEIPNMGTTSGVITWGTESVTHNFAGGTSDGAQPYGSLIQGSDGKLYGMTNTGGANNNGMLFQIALPTPAVSNPTPTIMHNFAGGASDGANPYSSLLQAGDGNFYGMTSNGGAYGAGTLFVYQPRVNAQLTPAPAATGWYNAGTGMPTLTLTGIDTTSFTYTVTKNGTAGSPVTATSSSATITFPSDGVYSVSYYGIDTLGRQISTRTTAADIDTTPPVTYMASTDNLVFLDPTDNFSGVAATYYTVDGGAQQTYTTYFQLPQDNGIHTITYWSVDVAGSVETANTATIDTRGNTFVYAQDVPGTANVLGLTPFSATLTQTDTHLPISGQTLTFTLADGTALGTAVTNSSGVATVKAQIPLNIPVGITTFTAAFAGDSTLKPYSDTGNVTIATVGTTVSASNRGSAGAPIPVGTLINPLKAELTANGANIPLPGYTINYQMNGTSIGSAVTSGNIASISYTLPDTLPIGANTLTVSFAGSDSLAASTGTAIYTIGPANTTMTPVYRSGAMGTLAGLTATLTSQITHLGVAGKTITFTVKGQTYTATTSVNGIATVFITLPNTKGTFTYTASFAGASNYNASSNIGYITVTN